MNAFKRIGICLVVCLLVSFLAIGFQVWSDLSTREDDVLTFTRLAMKDALVNIQTTEASSYNYNNRALTTSEFAALKNNYQAYLTKLQAAASGKGDSNLDVITAFLQSNKNAATPDGLFRPIQFGMTYVDEPLFKESFEKSINDLVAANYTNASKYNTGGISFTTKAPNALKIDSYTYVIDGPKLGNIPLNDGQIDTLYKSIYGIDNILNSSLKEELGFEDNAINFFVYYDITVTVNWSSASTNLLMTRNALFTLVDTFGGANKVNTGIEYTPSVNGSPEYVYIPGKPVTYNYRYVLTN